MCALFRWPWILGTPCSTQNVWSAVNSTIRRYKRTWNIGRSKWSAKAVCPRSRWSTRARGKYLLRRKSVRWCWPKWRKSPKFTWAERYTTISVFPNLFIVKFLNFFLVHVTRLTVIVKISRVFTIRFGVPTELLKPISWKTSFFILLFIVFT